MRFAVPLGVLLATAQACTSMPTAQPEPLVLFDGTSLAAFDTYFASTGVNSDPNGIFRIEDGALRVSGTEHGYFITKRSFRDYRLHAEFRWGEATFGGKKDKARDSGILYHVQGPPKVWPRSVEFQIQEGATGDFWLIDSGSVTPRAGVRVVGKPRQYFNLPRFGKGAWRDVIDYRDPNGEIERPHGEWNTLELIVRRDTVRHYVNGKLVNEGTDPYPKEGKILFQSEGAELYFRNITLLEYR
jgi:hypothetical protein